MFVNPRVVGEGLLLKDPYASVSEEGRMGGGLQLNDLHVSVFEGAPMNGNPRVVGEGLLFNEWRPSCLQLKTL